MEPAATIIRICGGHGTVADWLGIDVSRVYRWTYAKAKGGSAGLIPSQYHEPILLRARREGKDLLPDHFFPQFPEGASPNTRSAKNARERDVGHADQRGRNPRARAGAA